MSEDAPVNTGAVGWPHPGTAFFAVQRMQTKLHRWAGEDPSRRFGDLFNLVYDPAFLVHAFERVAASAGAKTAGVDGVTVTQIKAREGGELEFLAQLRDSLKSGEYQPAEVRQVMIPKGKTGKFRKPGIPTAADRVVQASLKAVLEPIFEFVLMVSGDRHHAEALREEVAAVLAPLGLRLSPEKTRVVHIDEGFDFLGFRIRRMRKRGTSKHYVYTTPAKKSIQSIKDRVRELTYRSTRHQTLAQVITSLNQALGGWANYFRHGVSKAVFGAVDHHAWGRLMRWTRRKYQGKHRLGRPEMKRRFCGQGWRFAQGKVVLTGASSVTVERYRYRGSNIPAPWTPKPAATASGG